MAPIRRYLRISKYSVLECRIFLENPADTRWLLDTTSRDPVLPRIFNTIKPHVLPKLREENERALAKKKSNPVKDVLVEEDFEVAIFLRESGTRHSLLTKQKTFGNRERIKSNSNILTGSATTEILVESDDEDNPRTGINMSDIPEVADSEDSDTEKRTGNAAAETTDNINDKKLQLTTSYEGFSIWGWVLCLLVTRKGHKSRKGGAGGSGAVASGQALMEEWIGTQMQPGLDED
ncbi:conserved hypothetical protein [Talaromyces stipitatus ATCC 10500]|uniref:Uncharacterized protein n=1 Tax=Talaromyces stipitatus (strain ATCC 10500 / CBS 375.48 / QM 6759 / NRRL 1006) TaxID=441959 RepID=B8M8F9_TALSN|nr:uncharacterized protein TSTA_036930 [Talaromyces stipitatus ATCC 10500]EED20472.1 conserved hypothetical protein [Talaromyces stipitatus ATCC 10500]